jgi:hypothetical protein
VSCVSRARGHRQVLAGITAPFPLAGLSQPVLPRRDQLALFDSEVALIHGDVRKRFERGF